MGKQIFFLLLKNTIQTLVWPFIMKKLLPKVKAFFIAKDQKFKAMVSALFVRSDSVYKQMGIDSWDMSRDARNFRGTNPVIVHPPCAQWGKLRHFARSQPGQKALALYAISLVRTNGGVLEHPAGSTLWPEYLPLPGQKDEFGGYTICIDQSWFGHKIKKKTFIYIVGCSPANLPPIPISFDAIEHSYSGQRRNRPTRVKLKPITKAEREHTPKRLAEWLVHVCFLISANQTSNTKRLGHGINPVNNHN